jgi:23S rRNA pseudouridine955/2504/2580 synthase
MADLTIPASADGQRLDRYLKSTHPDLPYIAVQKMIRTGRIRVDGKRCKPDQRLVEGQTVNLPDNTDRTMRHPDDATPKGQGSGAYQLTNADRALIKSITLFEDEHILVLNKPAGLAAQAGSGHTRSLDRILAALHPDNPPKLTHRLDRDTTGLIVLAKTRAAAAEVTRRFAERQVEKTYLALLAGRLKGEGGDIRAPLAKQSHAHGSRAVIDGEEGDHAHTSWVLVGSAGEALHIVQATPHTGRMNQLRAHFAHIGCPIVGDDKYGNRASRAAAEALHPQGRAPLYLHAWKLALAHPATGARLAFEAPLPDHFQALAEPAAPNLSS